MKSFKQYGIGLKIMTYFIILIMIPFFTLTFIQHFLSTSNLEDTLNQNTRQAIRQVQTNTDFYIREMEKLSTIIAKDPNVDYYMSHSSSDVSTRSNIHQLLRIIKESHEEIAGIMVLNNEDDYISNEMYKTSKDPLTSEDWYMEAMSTKDEFIISSPVGRNISTYANYSADEVISVITPIKSTQNLRNAGVIVMDMKLDTIESLMSEMTLGEEGFIYVMDKKGEVVYTPLNPVTYRIDPRVLHNQEPRFTTSIQGTSYEMTYSLSQYTGWKTIGVFKTKEIYAEVSTFRHYTFIIAILTFLLALLFTYMIEKRFTRPLISLRNLMKVVEDGNLEVSFTVQSQDEIGELGKGFNNMLQEIKHLLTMVEQVHKDKLDYELKALQAQIKPHFLYNTLDTILWMADEHEAWDITNVVKALTRLFRIGLSKGRTYITYKEEIQHIKSYLTIQKTRYEDELNYTIEADENLNKLQVLKLILQPMVENAIYHGIKEKDGPGHITIYSEIIDQELYLHVVDDGVGMSLSQENLINQSFTSKRTGIGTGYGMHNVNQRLKLAFGDDYGVYIQHSDLGCHVVIKHPILLEEVIENEDTHSR